ncbi:hypothetical protein HDU87_008178 [Geranomyces variabilis]|uniref:Uncharacterized protein n=1 Tax=Geranomyces variabilis TaxID=109894 RepID=A0AAD5XK03_9FUNG|nr:hypothetical protein HDU87_008178 [Geranomyces variabilis]
MTLDTRTLDVYTLAPLIVCSFDGSSNTSIGTTGATSDNNNNDNQPPSGRLSGTGTAVFDSGNTFQGSFPRGCMDGIGVYTWRNGVVYEGEFTANKISGKGVYTWKNGCRYEGQVKNGLRHGRGAFSCEPIAPARYEGEWREGKVWGEGKLTYGPAATNGGPHAYEGSWRNGLKHGHGIMRYASGNVYDGEWEANVKQGKGIMLWVDRGEIYDGEWRDGKPCGVGTYTWTLARTRPHQYPMSNSYRGEWRNGKQHGTGVFQYAHGARYEGGFKDGMKHGVGSFISENGRQYVGEWKDDRPVGKLADYKNDCPWTFNISDILAPPSANAGTPEEQLQGINNVVFRYNSELRDIYSYYAQPQRTTQLSSISTDKDRIPSIMTQVDLCRFLKDCGVLEKRVTLADCGRIYARQFEKNPCYTQVYNYPHSPDVPYIYFDMLSYLLRTSVLLYEGRTDLSLFDKGLAAGFSAFIKNDVLNRKIDDTASSGDADDYDEMLAFAKELAATVKSQYMLQIYDLYIDKAQHRPGKSLPHSVGDTTMTMREVLLMLSEYGLLSDNERSGPLTVAKVIEVFAKAGANVCDEGSYNLEHEMVPYEVYECLYACILVLHSAYRDSAVLPAVRGTDFSGGGTPPIAIAGPTAAPSESQDGIGSVHAFDMARALAGGAAPVVDAHAGKDKLVAEKEKEKDKESDGHGGQRRASSGRRQRGDDRDKASSGGGGDLTKLLSAPQAATSQLTTPALSSDDVRSTNGAEDVENPGEGSTEALTVESDGNVPGVTTGSVVAVEDAKDKDEDRLALTLETYMAKIRGSFDQLLLSHQEWKKKNQIMKELRVNHAAATVVGAAAAAGP